LIPIFELLGYNHVSRRIFANLKGDLIMPQIWLPMFPKGATGINDLLVFSTEEDTVTYYNGMMPIFSHPKDDIQSFRFILSQFYVNGAATQAELVAALGIPPVTLKRAVKLYREKGLKGFFEPTKRGGPRVLTPDVVAEAARLFEQGFDDTTVAERLGLKKDTLKKAIQKGKVKKKSVRITAIR
jgi:hypothetical protein